MSTSVDATPATLSRYGIDERQPEEKSTELGQDAFLKLMLTQLKHQDPFAPMENGEFLGQMAQFSTVSGIEKMSDSLEELSGAYGSSQTLQASQLVGREVLIDDTTLVLDEADEGAGAAGRFELDASSGSVTLDVLDPSGTLVRRIALGQHAAGVHDFHWDGLDDEGEPLAAGSYTASVTADGGEEQIAANVLVTRVVDSVEFAPGGKVQLNTGRGESITLDDIRQISERRPD